MEIIVSDCVQLRNYTSKAVLWYRTLEDHQDGLGTTVQPRGYVDRYKSGFRVMEEVQWGWTYVFQYLQKEDFDNHVIYCLQQQPDLVNRYLHNIILPTDAYNFVKSNYPLASNVYEIKEDLQKARNLFHK